MSVSAKSIARELGLSQSTVSLALRNLPGISAVSYTHLIVPAEYLQRVAYLEIVAPPAGKVFHNADTDFPVFHIVHHAGVGGTVKKPAAFVIVDVVPDIG